MIGSEIIDNPTHLFEKKNVFKITYAGDAKTDLFLSARSEIEKKQWIFSIRKIQILAQRGTDLLDIPN